MATPTNPPAVPRRRRSSSIKEVLTYLREPTNPENHHLLSLRDEPRYDSASPLPPPPPARPRPRSKTSSPAVASSNRGPAMLRWIQRPEESFRIIMAIVGLYSTWEIIFPTKSPKSPPNYIQHFLFISYPLVPDPGTEHLIRSPSNPTGEVTRFGKGWIDVCFLVFYVVVFSFVRQGVTLHFMHPLGLRLGIKKGKKLDRFMEQGYAVVYFAASSIFGLYVMSRQNSWWYKTEEFFRDYPHGGPTSAAGGMTALVKVYYLLQFSYWLQQALVMIAQLEAPRDDYVELILHHIITLWLVGVSYWINLTQVGIAIFVSMDIPDVILAFSKCVSYCGLPEIYGNCSFIVFMAAWGYLRHYQNIRILHTVWTKFDLVPLEAQFWDPPNGHYLPPWMIYHVFTPIFLLQIVIAFWSYLILRIVARMLTGNSASDVREEQEGDTENEGGNSEMEGKKASIKKRN